MSEIICPSCHSPAPPGAIFCDNCGYDLRASALARPPASIPPLEVGAGQEQPVPKPRQAEEVVICAVCGHNNLPGSAFCENCGAQLPPIFMTGEPQSIPQVEEVTTEPVRPQAPPGQQAAAALTGRIYVQGVDTSLPIPSGVQSIIIGREDPVSGIFPDINLEPFDAQDAGVGRRHARLGLHEDHITLEDLNSVNGTLVNRQRLTPNQPVPLQDGDEIRLGKMVLIYYNS